uniref:Cyanocobalamin reductase (cyanide-eliminating) n=1 Tax=Crassostrea virginica TaxID=6565 RepID=A0A8B8BW94_CRAVI|nr:LOW QUALITY PROTEIN: methylmalonic aciduria and homocystinuria type C protein homolog [Crassostrea virginica]
MERIKTILNPLIEKVRATLEAIGFEVHPFKVEWYNEYVEEKYKLPYPDDTFGLFVNSIPDMWEKAFIAFIKTQTFNEEEIPLHQCMIYNFDKVKQFPEHDIEVMHQFEIPNGQAKILVQTAAHVAGAAYYYQRRDVTGQPWPADKKIFGVCYHPVYGGWVSLDGVFIFKDVLCPDLPQRAPRDVIPSQEKRVELLEKFNFPQWSYRDLLPVPRKYCEEHKEYLSTTDIDQKISIAKRIKSRCT